MRSRPYDGASSGNLAALLEQTAKYGVRAFLFNQNPERLTPATLNAVTTNRSHLHTTALNSKAATLLTREWSGAVDPEVITRLRRYTYLASVTLDTEISAPFLVHGVPADELFPDAHHPDQLAALEEAIDRNTERRAVTETLEALADHDRNIINYLRQRRETGRSRTVAGGHGERTIGPPQ
jgi:hypothetical protein